MFKWFLIMSKPTFRTMMCNARLRSLNRIDEDIRATKNRIFINEELCDIGNNQACLIISRLKATLQELKEQEAVEFRHFNEKCF